MTARLRTKLLIWLLVPLTLLLATDTLVSYRIALRFAERAYDRSLVEIAREVGLRVRATGRTPVLDLPDAAREVLFADPSDEVFFEVSAGDGSLVAGRRIARSSGQLTVNGDETLYDATVDGKLVRVVELRVGGAGAAPLVATVRVAETLTKRTELTREILASVVLPQVVLILAAALLVVVGVVAGLGPLDRLRRAIALRSHRDLSPLDETGVPGEVLPLVHSVNGLLTRLDHVLRAQNRFIADAAHHLKTPVAGLKAQMELVVRETDPMRVREAVGRLLVAVERLSRLVTQLLALARNEPEVARSLTLVPVDLAAIVFEATASWVPSAYARRIDLGFEGGDQPLQVVGEPVRLRELVDNLIDNAVRYSREGGRVTVRVAGGSAPRVAISDDGPLIPAEERVRIFERFHRLIDAGSDGSGLGLAIAREIAVLHGARIEIAPDTDGVGNLFTVIFPEREPG